MSPLFCFASALALSRNVPRFPFHVQKELCGISKWEMLAQNCRTGGGERLKRARSACGISVAVFKDEYASSVCCATRARRHSADGPCWHLGEYMKMCFKTGLESKQKMVVENAYQRRTIKMHKICTMRTLLRH